MVRGKADHQSVLEAARMRRVMQGLAMLLGALLAAACVVPPNAAPGSVAAQAQTQTQAPAKTGKDHITASDETDLHKRARLRLELATGYFTEGKMNTALDEIKQSIAIDGGTSESFGMRGLIYDQLGDDVLAEESYKRALELDATDASVMQNYGWFLCKRKRYDLADEWLGRAIERPLNPGRAQALLVRGVCQLRNGQPGKAETYLQRAYELDPSNPATGVNLAQVLYQRGDLDRARFYVGRVNAKEGLSNAETLWLAIRIEHRRHDSQAEAALSAQLRSRFPESREAAALDAGRFEE